MRFFALTLASIACPRRGWRRVVGPSLLSLATACASPPAAHTIEPASSSHGASETHWHWPDAAAPFDRTNIIGKLKAFHAVVEAWRVNNTLECPTIERLKAERELGPATSTNDDWGTPYLVLCDDDETHIVSYGPDRRRETADDIVYPERGDTR